MRKDQPSKAIATHIMDCITEREGWHTAKTLYELLNIDIPLERLQSGLSLLRRDGKISCCVENKGAGRKAKKLYSRKPAQNPPAKYVLHEESVEAIAKRKAKKETFPREACNRCRKPFKAESRYIFCCPRCRKWQMEQGSSLG